MDCYLLILLIIFLSLSLIGLYLLLDCLGDSSFSSMARRASTAMGAADEVYSKFSASEDLESGDTTNSNGKSAGGPLYSAVPIMSHTHGDFHPAAVHTAPKGKKDQAMGAGAGTVALLVSTLHRGSQSYHSQGLCNVGGGNWSNGHGVWASGRPSGPNTWSRASGGAFDRCQCEDSGGLF